jgi:hypothetical protein
MKDHRAKSRISMWKGGGRDAKVWLEPEPVIAESYGFNSREITEHRELILRAWHEHFGDGSSI